MNIVLEEEDDDDTFDTDIPDFHLAVANALESTVVYRSVLIHNAIMDSVSIDQFD